MSERKPELVLAVNRQHLAKVGIIESPTLQHKEFVDTKDYAFLPRDFADNKQEETGGKLGSIFAQVLPYGVVINHEGKYLAYQRKGSEEGLRGQWSIGVGGHISQQDLYASAYPSNPSQVEYLPWLSELILRGTQRELTEELGVVVNMYNMPEDPMLAFNHIINMGENIVDRVHVAYVHTVNLDEDKASSLNLDPLEFGDNWCWATADELVAGLEDFKGTGNPFENWSKVIIEAFDVVE